MFDLDKEAKSEVLDEILEMVGKRSKDKLFKVFGLPEDMKGKVSVSEKSYVIPFGKKKEDLEEKEDNKESLSDDIAHFEDVYKDEFDRVDGDDPYDGKLEADKKEDEEEDEDKEKKLMALLQRMLLIKEKR
jgi:hypothetical protein